MTEPIQEVKYKRGWADSPNYPNHLQWWNGKEWSNAWWPKPVLANGGTYQPEWPREFISQGKHGTQLDIVGENWHEEAIQNAVGDDLKLDQQVTVERVVELVPEPDNPYDSNAISVRYENQVLGYIAAEQAPDFLPLVTTVIKARRVPTVAADIWAVKRNTRNGIRIYSNVRINLSPELEVPENNAPSRPYSIIPRGRTVQVIGEEKHFDVLSEYISKEPLNVLVTLEIETVTTSRTEKEIIGIYLDDRPVGTLSPATSISLIPTIRYLNEQQGVVAVAWAKVIGSRLAAEIKLDITRAESIDDEFLDGDPVHLKEFKQLQESVPNAYMEVIDPGPPPSTRGLATGWGILIFVATFVFLFNPATLIFSAAGIAFIVYYYMVLAKKAPAGSLSEPAAQ